MSNSTTEPTTEPTNTETQHKAADSLTDATPEDEGNTITITLENELTYTGEIKEVTRNPGNTILLYFRAETGIYMMQTSNLGNGVHNQPTVLMGVGNEWEPIGTAETISIK